MHQYAIVFAVVISTFTSLRFSFLGLGEATFIVLGGTALMQYFTMPKYRQFIFSGFWLFYLCLGLFAFAYNQGIHLGTGTYAGMAFDSAAYFMLFISCLAIERRFILYNEDAYHYIRLLFFFFMLLMTFLFALSLVTPSILGLPLRYYQHFAPLVKNLHQVAMLLAPMPFIGLMIFQRESAFNVKIIVAGLSLLAIVMIIDTGSVKAKMGIVAGLATYMVSYFYRKSPVLSFLFACASGVSLLVLMSSVLDLGELMKSFFNEHDGHGGRSYLYSAAIELIKESFLFGRGNGPHIYYIDKFNDSHQTFLTVLLQTGIVGCAIFVALLVKVLRQTLIGEPATFAALTAIMIYAAGGDILRRLPIWGLIIILFFVARQRYEKEREATTT